MYDDRHGSGKALPGPVPDAGILIHVMAVRGQTADDRNIDHTTEDPMDKTMKAAVARAFGKPLAIEEVAVPRPGAGELLVKIEACGVCHTDLHAVEGDWPVKPNPPFIPGHEGVGHVVAVGAGVTHVKEGDRVGIPWLYPPAAIASIAWAAGKRCANSSRTPAIRSTAASPNIRWPRPTTWAAARQHRLRGHRARAVRRRHRVQGPEDDRHAPGNWVVISASAGLATWRCSMPAPWA